MIIQKNFINSTVDVTSCEIKKKNVRFYFIFPEETLWLTILMTAIKLSKKQKKYHNTSCLFVLNSWVYLGVKICDIFSLFC